MKRQIRIKSIWVAAALVLLAGGVFVSCDKEDLPRTPGEESGVSLAFAIADGGYAPEQTDTRAAENGMTTQFTEGDACGLYVVKDGKVTVANMKLTAKAQPDATGSGSTTLVWEVEDKELKHDAQNSYFVYYPYKQHPDDAPEKDKPNTAHTNEEFFKEMIKKWNVRTDQSDYTSYTASDLMTAKGEIQTNTVQSGKKSIEFSMTHHMALTVVELPKKVYKFTNTTPSIPDYTPPSETILFSSSERPYHMTDGTLRYLYNPNKGEPTAEISCYYADSKREFTITPFHTSGKFKKYVVDGGSSNTIKKEHELQPGDFFLADGNLLSKNTDGATVREANVIGIVFCTDASRVDEKAISELESKKSNFHALVMATSDATPQCTWGNENMDETGGPFAKNTDNTEKMWNNVNGYKETQHIIKTYGPSGNNTLENKYPAFYYTMNYGTKTNDSKKHKAPENTTGWFLPSIGQWWTLLETLGEINKDHPDLDTFKENQSGTDAYTEKSISGNIKKLNSCMSNVGGGSSFDARSVLWSSSESDQDACVVRFGKDDKLHLTLEPKASSHSVRCILAF